MTDTAAHGIPRDLQLSFGPWGAEKPLGPIVGSVQTGDNAQLIKAVAPLYLTGSVLDTTFGTGGWWRHFRPDPFTFHDLATDGIDARALPYEAGAFETVCFDPPYIAIGTPGNTTARARRFHSSFGLTGKLKAADVAELLEAGTAEACRVASRWVLVKSCDYTDSGRLRLGLPPVFAGAERAGAQVWDLIAHVAPGGSVGEHRTRTIVRTGRRHSYLTVLKAPS